jgi:CheY-like chemotaxis protein
MLFASIVWRYSKGDRCAVLLIVDDEPEIRELLVECLALEGHIALIAANGSEALELAREVLPSLILLDLNMPVLNGWAFLSERLADPLLSKVPVLVMSGSSEVARAKAAGAAAVIRKPFTPSELLPLVEKLLAAA